MNLVGEVLAARVGFFLEELTNRLVSGVVDGSSNTIDFPILDLDDGSLIKVFLADRERIKVFQNLEVRRFQCLNKCFFVVA